MCSRHSRGFGRIPSLALRLSLVWEHDHKENGHLYHDTAAWEGVIVRVVDDLCVAGSRLDLRLITYPM